MYLAHSGRKEGGKAEPLKEHLNLVSERAASYAGFFDAAGEAGVAGLFHDLGKYSERFLRRLENKEEGLDHWTAGAYTILVKFQHKAWGAALAIQGHHIGLQHAHLPSLKEDLSLKKLYESHPLNLRLTESDDQLLLQRFLDDGFQIPGAPERSVYDPKSPSVAGMLDVRMLFSALVDADYIETEAHFEGDLDGTKRYRPDGPELDAAKAIEALNSYLSQLSNRASDHVTSIRNDLRQACLDAARWPPGLFTLSAPTGAGKTLAMLAFALHHAQKYPDSIRRIVVVIPYLSIIEQTADIYRKIFEPFLGSFYLLEHHSLTGFSASRKDDSQDNENAARRTAGLLAENWDAPIVITTSVQGLESLFSNRPSACRKLHRLAGSIILFDEVQTLPPKLALPTLAALSHLAERYGATVVFSTATQPAFSHLHKKVCEFSHSGWNPREIVPEQIELFTRARRTRLVWEVDTPCSWEALADKIVCDESNQVLCVVNLKRHAQRLFLLLKGKGVSGLFHMSTSMCPAHRQQILAEVRKRLNSKAPKPCYLISTQCIEAGVDVDFPTVYRSFGPLEAIAQAAGRCNRNGNLENLGVVNVFLPELEEGEKSLYPPGGYQQAADVTRTLIRQLGPKGMDINDPCLFKQYYCLLYDLLNNIDPSEELKDALGRLHFVDTARQYRLIDQDAINILVPYNLRNYQKLTEKLEQEGRLTREWVGRARPYTVSLFRPKRDDEVWNFLQPVPLGRNEWADDWYIYLKPKHYSQETGLNPIRGVEAWYV